jgi:hypothetical protein
MEDCASIAAQLAAPAPRGADGVAELLCALASLPLRKEVTVGALSQPRPLTFAFSGPAPPPALPRQLRALLRHSSVAAAAQRRPPSAAFACVVVRCAPEPDGGGDGGAGGGAALQVASFCVAPHRCVRVPPHLNRAAQCLDPDTGAALEPEPGVAYL